MTAPYLGALQPVTTQSTIPWPKLNDAAFSADGTTLYTYTRGEQGVVDLLITVDVASNSVTSTYDLGRVDSTALTSVLTPPDQAPVASFTTTVACPGTGTVFDATSSSAAGGSISSYAWDFGDGSPTVTTSSPTTSHTYATVAKFTVRLTVTDAAGTSTEVVFDGQTVLRNGRPTATARTQVRVPACARPV